MLVRKADYVNLYESYRGIYPDVFLSNILTATGRGGTYATRDYERALCLLACLEEVSLTQEQKSSLVNVSDVRDYIHPAVWFRRTFDSVNLAYRYDELSEPEQKVIFDSPDWCFSRKIDGFRVWLIAYNRPGYEPVVKMFSRNLSDVDCSLCEYWSHVFQTITIPENTIFVADCECEFSGDPTTLAQYGLVADTKLAAATSLAQMDPMQALAVQQRYLENTGEHYFVFNLIHPIFYKGRNYTKRLLGEGIDVYDEVVAFGQSLGFNIQPISRCNGSADEKRAFLDAILAAGGEGVVAWNRKGHYTASENRDKTSWVKIKRSVTSEFAKAGMGDSVDAFVTGFKLSKEGTGREGLIGALECSVWLVEADGSTHKHVISYCPGLSLELAKAATVTAPDGTVSLHPDFMGRVVELDGQDISAKSLRISHPRLKGFRFDKEPQDCKISRAWLESQIL